MIQKRLCTFLKKMFNIFLCVLFVNSYCKFHSLIILFFICKTAHFDVNFISTLFYISNYFLENFAKILYHGVFKRGISHSHFCSNCLSVYQVQLLFCLVTCCFLTVRIFCIEIPSFLFYLAVSNV